MRVSSVSQGYGARPYVGGSYSTLGSVGSIGTRSYSTVGSIRPATTIGSLGTVSTGTYLSAMSSPTILSPTTVVAGPTVLSGGFVSGQARILSGGVAGYQVVEPTYEVAKAYTNYWFSERPEGCNSECIYGGTVSVPCRLCWYLVSMCNLPVDMVGISFDQEGLYSEDMLKVNPIHSLPFFQDLTTGQCINGSESLIPYLVSKYRHLVPDSYYPRDAFACAQMLEKFNFINGVGYRATMYQYVYPKFGLMTECQYDLCKRDFYMETVEGWLSQQKYLGGGDGPSMADFMLYSLWTGNQWMDNDEKFGDGKVAWRMKDVIANYPNTANLLAEIQDMECCKEVENFGWPEKQAAPYSYWSAELFGQLFGDKPSPKGRVFKQDGDMVHPNVVAFVLDPDSKAAFDIPQY